MSDSSFDRRDFLRAGAVAGALAVGLRADALVASPRPVPVPVPVPEFDLEEATVADLVKRMEGGSETAESLARKYLARIEAVDKSGPGINCVIETNPDALEIARRFDEERKAGKVRGPLHGIPVIIKDNLATADRMQTTAGSMALYGSKPPRDSHVAARLREAGAVILAKANLSEWANFRSTHSTSGWSGRGGLCHNPYALDRNTSGSSAGTGGAIAANLAAVGIGTETDGSIVSPSTCNGLVGIKPTVGLVSRTGIVPISHSQDTAGPMTRTVSDAAILLSAITGYDAGDAAMKGSQARAGVDYRSFLKADGLKGVRIGVVRENLMGYSVHADAVAEETIKALRSLGAEIVDPANFAAHIGKEIGKAEYEVLLYEYKADLAAYFAWLGPDAPVKSLGDVIAFNEANKERELKYFGQEIMLMSEKKGPLTAPAYQKALAGCRRLSRTEGIDALMTRHKLDALFAPTGGPAPLIDLVNGDPHGGGGSSTMAAVAGYPHITVPGGFAYGLPIGVSFFGRAWSEGQLIRIAYNFEQATKARRAPKFLRTAET